MEQVQEKGAAVEELGVNFLTLLSSSIVNKFEKELEKRGMLFTPELSEQLRKFIVESFNEIQSSSPSPITEQVVTATPILEKLTEATLPPLIFQFTWDCRVLMGMMINGKPEVLENEKGSRSTPAYSGFTDDSRLVYGTDAELHRHSRGNPDFWRSLYRGGPNRTVNLKEFGIFDLPALFFHALLIRKLKITAEESQCNGGLCQAAILAVPMETTCQQRLHLKEAALFAGFKDTYVISAEGLAAYYWFHKNETEREENNYSKDFVIVQLLQTVVVYKRSFKAGTDGEKNIVVTPLVSLSFFSCLGVSEGRDKFLKMMRKILKIVKNAVIPFVGTWSLCPLFSNHPRGLDENKIKRVYEDESGSDPSEYFTTKGAALLSGNPENIGRQVRNMMETVSIEAANYTLPDIKITHDHDQILPETFAQQTFTIKHVTKKYRIRQKYETVGYLVINEVELGSDLQVTCEPSWEGIWKVVGVSAKNPCDTDEGFEAVSWKWLIGDKMDVPQFGRSSYEECRSLLMKILPSPNQAKVALIKDESSGGLPLQTLDEAMEASVSVCGSGDGNGKGKMLATKSTVTLPNDTNGSKFPDKLLKRARSSTSQVKRRSARLTKVGSTTSASGLGSSQDESVGLGSSTTDRGDRSEVKEKKRSRKRGVISTTDIVVNTGLKKIKLESDWVEPVVKIEQDSVDDLGEDGNGQQVNFVEIEEEIKIEEDLEDVGKIKVEEEENIAD